MHILIKQMLIGEVDLILMEFFMLTLLTYENFHKLIYFLIFKQKLQYILLKHYFDLFCIDRFRFIFINLTLDQNEELVIQLDLYLQNFQLFQLLIDDYQYDSINHDHIVLHQFSQIIYSPLYYLNCLKESKFFGVFINLSSIMKIIVFLLKVK